MHRKQSTVHIPPSSIGIEQLVQWSEQNEFLYRPALLLFLSPTRAGWTEVKQTREKKLSKEANGRKGNFRGEKKGWRGKETLAVREESEYLEIME